MTRPLRIVTPEDRSHILHSIDDLKRIRDTLKKGGAKRAALYVSRALKSVEGAARRAKRAMFTHRLRACTEGKPGERVHAHSQWHEIVERLPNGILLVRTFERVIVDGKEQTGPRDALSAIDSTIARGYVTRWSSRSGEERWLLHTWSRDHSKEIQSARFKTREQAERALRDFLAKCPA